MTKDFWDERYSKAEYAYGEEPNEYLKEQLQKFPAGKILFPAEGEGRNSVYAATQGWDTHAFDQSKEGKNKALQLAEKNKVTIDYQVGALEAIHFNEQEFDAIALFYAHFPADKKSAYHKILDSYLKKGGIIIFEAFSKTNLEYIAKNPRVGGPKDVDMLFSVAELKEDFPNYEIIELEEAVVNLNEGQFHTGEGAVIRFVGKKK